ncbi:MAG: trimethylamine methyltransferase family protein, partial [Planctomycetota bacterium]|nr:trimethylamine methyltransferase family protein [Planctomycetota bacterium]
PGLQLDLAGSMPCTGLTSPMHLPGTLVQSLAEAIAVAACTRALGCGGGVGAIRCDPCDMRSGNYVIGSPEFQLLDMATRALYRTITGATYTGGAFRSMAKGPDAQAMAERCFTVLFQALQGARNFGHAGQMSMDGSSTAASSSAMRSSTRGFSTAPQACWRARRSEWRRRLQPRRRASFPRTVPATSSASFTGHAGRSREGQLSRTRETAVTR